MTEEQWKVFTDFKIQFKKECTRWSEFSEQLYPLQRNAATKDTPVYSLENAVVYNEALDTLTQADDIRCIVIGDNPGKEEQLESNKKYLVGQSGRIAEGFFRRHPELHTDFRKNVIILNKTPIHTAKTAHLQYLEKYGSQEIKNLIIESQKWMAKATAQLHQKLGCQLWLVGYAELKGKGIFLPYRDCLKMEYIESNKYNKMWDNVFVYQHFSMNRFLIDLNAYQKSHLSMTIENSLVELGHLHRDEIFNG